MSSKKVFLASAPTGIIPIGNLMFYQRFNNSVTDQTGNYGTTSSGVTYANGFSKVTSVFFSPFIYTLVPTEGI